MALALLAAMISGGMTGVIGVSHFIGSARSSISSQQEGREIAPGREAASRQERRTASAARGSLSALPSDWSGGIFTATTAPPENIMGTAEPSLATSFAQFAHGGFLAPAREPRVLQASLSVEAPDSGMLVINKTPPPDPIDLTFTIGKDEELADRLAKLGVRPAVALALLERLRQSRAEIPAGARITLTLDRQLDFFGSDVIYPVYLSFIDARGRRIVVDTDEDGGFLVRAITPRRDSEMAAQRDFFRVRGRITSTLYAAARDQGIPRHIISQMLRAFSHQVDLQRQIRKGDTFEVLYGKSLSGAKSRRPILHYAALSLSGRKLVFYRYATRKGKVAYFDANGRSSSTGLMITPISGARITSGYGMRRHPILGYTKMHTGIDFAAPRGTPIRAAGSGVVVHAGWRGGYGRTVIIKHDNGYETLYAHQSRIARGIRKGIRVRQGQVIGYLGATGRVTGPHLHYEVRRNGKRINPRRVRVASNIRLSGKELAAFRQHKKRIDELLRGVPVNTQVAQK